MKKNKVIIIGIDGGTFDIIRPMIARGELPVLTSLMEKGAWGELESTIPPDTSPAWVSMMTGVNPGKHGIFFFLDNLHNNARNGRPLGSGDIKFPPLWSVLSREKKNVIFINVPFTYPPMEVNGVVISGMFVPNSASIISYPPEVYTDLVNKLGKYEIDDWSLEAIGADRSKISAHYDRIIKGISLVTEKRKMATLMLLEEKPWDFAMVVFTSADRLQHLFWKFMNPPTDNHDSELSRKYGGVIQQGYRQVDRAIGEIMEKAGHDTTVIIVSDHGFGPLEKHFFTNKWLEEIGLLKRKKRMCRKKFDIRLTNLHRALAKFVPDNTIPNWTKKIPVPVPQIKARDRSELIDWQKTKAYGNQCGININLKGREPDGIVEPGKEMEELLTFIQTRFYQLKDEASGEVKIPDWICRKEEIYNGPYIKEADDLYFSLKNRSYLPDAKVDVNVKFDRPLLGSGMHRRNGIFIMSGPLSRKRDSIAPRIIDISPTVLYLMGLPVFEEMDGRILEEAIDPAYLKSHPIKVVSSVEYSGKGSYYSAEDEEKIAESLKRLGYL
ncbi:MAG: alkaline phosphatase family protein [Candidatus Brocadia sp.]|jgi:predicted AlkP superfamily phosphohydrolase/phosphomutase